MQLSAPPSTLLRGASLFLDFDGTLVHLADTPGAVVVSPQLLRLLTSLQERLDGRLALISGRAADEVIGLLHPFRVALAGSHGGERVDLSGCAQRDEPHPELAEVIGRLGQLERDHPGILVEAKPYGFALHYRLAPNREDFCRQTAEQAAQRLGFILQPGKMVIEVKPRGADKGTALAQFMREAPFAGSRPVFIGDDFTDEAAFRVARELGGDGVLVGEMRSTAAGYHLRDVDMVHQWLTEGRRRWREFG